MKNLFLYTFYIIFLNGCAGSANHRVLSSHESGDDALSCTQIEDEILVAQAIIDEVNQDKEDVSGAYVVDGLLYFPFNIIAKSNNYNKAIEAADNRIENLQTLKKEKHCNTESTTEQNS